MPQDYPDIAASDFVSASRVNILARDDTLKSNFSGTAFPVTGLEIGQTCYRTDLSKMYFLESTGPSVWRELQNAAALGTAALKNTGTSGNNVPLLDGANTWSAAQTFSAALNIGTQLLNTTGGSISGNTDLRLNAGSGKDISFLINSVSRMKLYADGGLTVGAPTSNSLGAGSLNAEYIYLNGAALGTAATKNLGTSGDTVPKNNTANTFSENQTISKSSLASLLLATTANSWRVENSNGTFQIGIDGAASSFLQIVTGGGFVFGSATGGAQAAGTINAKGFYQDGVLLSSGKTQMQIFTSSGTWTKPAGFTGKIKVTVLGGGGGGYGNSGNGTTGGTSSFGSHCSASGGGFGGSLSFLPNGYALGGVGSGGDLNLPGDSGWSQNSYISQTNTLYSTTTKAGDSPFGFGGVGYTLSGSGLSNYGAAIDSRGYGAGGRSRTFESGSGYFQAYGGAAGGIAIKLIDAAALSGTETVTVGAGGAAGGTSGQDGRPGLVIVEYVG